MAQKKSAPVLSTTGKEPEQADVAKRLAAPFPPSWISWRIAQAGKDKNGKIWAKCLAYMDGRCVINRLDEVFGIGNWYDRYVNIAGGVRCTLWVKIGGEWIGKEDAAEDTDIESIKGGHSNALKRAGVKWGIGRYLYNLEETWAQITDDQDANYAGKNEKKGLPAFYWNPPQLPAWALPVGYEAKPKSGPAPKTEPEKKDQSVAGKPAAGVSPNGTATAGVKSAPSAPQSSATTTTTPGKKIEAKASARASINELGMFGKDAEKKGWKKEQLKTFAKKKWKVDTLRDLDYSTFRLFWTFVKSTPPEIGMKELDQ